MSHRETRTLYRLKSKKATLTAMLSRCTALDVHYSGISQRKTPPCRQTSVYFALHARPQPQLSPLPRQITRKIMPLPSYDPATYPAQLAGKLAHFEQNFAPLGVRNTIAHASTPLHYRLRAEFRIWHDGDRRRAVHLLQRRADVAHDALEGARHVVERAVGEHDRVFE